MISFYEAVIQEEVSRLYSGWVSGVLSLASDSSFHGPDAFSVFLAYQTKGMPPGCPLELRVTTRDPRVPPQLCAASDR